MLFLVYLDRRVVQLLMHMLRKGIVPPHDYPCRSAPNEWVKVNMDASRRHWMKSILIGYVVGDQHSKVVMMESKRIGNYAIFCDKMFGYL